MLLISGVTVGLAAGNWQSLKKDRLHDPDNPAIEMLQEPAEALAVLEHDSAGNQVDWVASLQKGLIEPRSGLKEDQPTPVRTTIVLMKNTYPLPYVGFDHGPHTQWMACENCHESIFVSAVDANPINMGNILEGEYCGVCHGAVAFPLTECNRCHNTDSTAVGNNDVSTAETTSP